jgi:hypothetical protein
MQGIGELAPPARWLSNPKEYILRGKCASGYLLFVRQNALMAQRFDPSSGELKGQASVLNDDVQVHSSAWRET